MRALHLVLLLPLAVHALLAAASTGSLAAGAPALQGRDEERAERERREQLRVQLAEPDPTRRRSAVLALAKAGKLEDWLLVIDALADREAQVADEAQLKLEGLGMPELLPKLYGRGGLQAKEELVRLRAAEALGRVQLQVDGELLVGRLARSEARFSRLLLWTLERQGRAGRVEGRGPRIAYELERYRCSVGEAELQAAALLALCAIDPAAARLPAAAARKDRDGALRCAALLAAAACGWPELEEWCRLAASDPEARVRATTLEVLRERATPAVLRVLVERLSAESLPALRARLVDVLQEVSGMRFQQDPRPWKLWLERLPEGWSPARRERREAQPQQEQTFVSKEPVFPVLGERLCFLFDFSGSMWTALPDGRQPKDVVGVKLREALQTLQPQVHFNLIPFSSMPIAWEARLAPAKPARVREALEFFDGCQARGRGNFLAAAQLALRDPDVERIVTLTDDVPTGGEHCNMDLIVPLLLESIRFRQVAFDTILVDAPAHMLRRWQELALRSGGRLIEAELR